MVLSPHDTDDALIERYLEPDPNTGDPAEWRLKELGVPVWALAAVLAPDASNAAQVIRDYRISEKALAAARAYYRRHQEVIDGRLLANRSS